MCSSRTELHFIISFAADDFWLQSLIKVNNQKLARTRDVNVLEFASLNWTILRKLIHRALFFSLCAPLVAGIILCWSERLLSRYRRRGWRGGFIVFSPLRLLLRLLRPFTSRKEAHFLWLLWTRLVATFCVVCFARALGPTSAHMRSFSIHLDHDDETGDFFREFFSPLCKWWWCYMFTKFSPLTLHDVFIRRKEIH